MSEVRTDAESFPALFLSIAFAWAWAFWSVPLVTAHGWMSIPGSDKLLFPFLVLGAFGPFVAALAVNLRQGTAPRFFKRALRWRIPVVVLLTALLLTPALAGLATWLRAEQGGPAFVIGIGWKDGLLLAAILFFVGGSCNEEFGWAFAIDRLQPRLGFLRGSLLLGVIWACWHIPLFFVPTLSQAHMPFWAFVVTCCSIRIAMVWGYNYSNQSILLPLLFHTSMNLTQNIFPTLNPVAARGNQPLFLCYAALLAGAAVVIVLIRYSHARADKAFTRVTGTW